MERKSGRKLTFGGSFCSMATGIGSGSGKKPSCLWKWFLRTKAKRAALFTIFFLPASAGEGAKLIRQATRTAQQRICTNFILNLVCLLVVVSDLTV